MLSFEVLILRVFVCVCTLADVLLDHTLFNETSINDSGYLMTSDTRNELQRSGLNSALVCPRYHQLILLNVASTFNERDGNIARNLPNAKQ
jgi:hypothetical protein